jgi:hypothetical protein
MSRRIEVNWEEIARLYESGVSTVLLAEQAGCAPVTIRLGLQKRGVETRSPSEGHRRTPRVQHPTPRRCEWCSSPFVVYPRSKQRTCSMSCSAYLRWETRRKAKLQQADTERPPLKPDPSSPADVFLVGDQLKQGDS